MLPRIALCLLAVSLCCGCGDGPGKTYKLTVAVGGDNWDTEVTSDPEGFYCVGGQTCSDEFPAGSTVTIGAGITEADFGPEFIGWGGACSGDGLCVLKMTSDLQVSAEFGQPTTPKTLTVTVAGSGTVTSQPFGIDCAADAGVCSSSFAYGDQVALTAIPDSGTFAGWGGACSGAASCTVTMTNDQTVMASF